MSAALNKQSRPEKGWLTKTALAVFAVVALADLTGCAALQNSADTLGNAAGSQVTKTGLWLMGKDADCEFNSRNHSTYNVGGPGHSGTVTHNGCRELPSTAAQIKIAEQQEAIRNVHFREQQKRMDEIKKAQEIQRAEMMARRAADTCHQRELDLLRQGKPMDEKDACTGVLQQEKAKVTELAAKTPSKSTGFWSGWTLKD